MTDTNNVANDQYTKLHSSRTLDVWKHPRSIYIRDEDGADESTLLFTETFFDVTNKEVEPFEPEIVFARVVDVFKQYFESASYFDYFLTALAKEVEAEEMIDVQMKVRHRQLPSERTALYIDIMFFNRETEAVYKSVSTELIIKSDVMVLEDSTLTSELTISAFVHGVGHTSYNSCANSINETIIKLFLLCGFIETKGMAFKNIPTEEAAVVDVSYKDTDIVMGTVLAEVTNALSLVGVDKPYAPRYPVSNKGRLVFMDRHLYLSHHHEFIFDGAPYLISSSIPLDCAHFNENPLILFNIYTVNDELEKRVPFLKERSYTNNRFIVDVYAGHVVQSVVKLAEVFASKVDLGKKYLTKKLEFIIVQMAQQVISTTLPSLLSDRYNRLGQKIVDYSHARFSDVNKDMQQFTKENKDAPK